MNMEEVFLRFPHLGEKILLSLDYKSLIKCRMVAKHWKESMEVENSKYIILNQKLGNYDLIAEYDLDKHLSEKDDKWLEDNINVMLSVIQCVTYKCIGEKHPLEKLLQNIAKKLNEDRENDS